jgi:hypothetical protein
MSAITNAWNGEYIGEHHRLLLNNINHMERARTYSNSVAILQRSGTGKSCMVHEQADLVLTLPFNLRPSSETKGDYPPSCIDSSILCKETYLHPDCAIRNYLDQPISDLQEGQTICYRLLGHLFSIVSEELIHLYGKARQLTYAELAKSWRRHMQDDQNRATIYEKAVKKCGDDLVCPQFTIPHSNNHCSR